MANNNRKWMHTEVNRCDLMQSDGGSPPVMQPKAVTSPYA